jgi:hypothetical protein
MNEVVLATDEQIKEALNKNIVPDDDPVGIDPITDDAPLIGNSADVANQIRQINQLREDVSGFKIQADEAAQFYVRRVQALEARADMLTENVGRWLKLNGLNKLSTHSGTVFFSKKNKVTLPSDDVLLTFIKANDPDNTMGLIKESPNKGDLKKYIASSGLQPEGYMEEKSEGISIRKVA